MSAVQSGRSRSMSTPLLLLAIGGLWVSVNLASAHAEPAQADGRGARALAEITRIEPSLDELRIQALEHAALRDFDARSLGRRARWSGVLPVLTIRATRGSGHDEELSRLSSGDERLDVGLNRDLAFEARAVWELDRLIFAEAELRVEQTAQRVRRERAQLLAQITSIYFQRRKLQVAALWAPAGADPAKAALSELAIAELGAQLDALTGGYFSATIARRRAASVSP